MSTKEQLRLIKNDYERNIVDISRLQMENEKLEHSLRDFMTESHEMSWEILKTYLNTFLKTSAFVRSVKQITMDDCKLEIRSEYVDLREIVVWYIVLPMEVGILEYWPEIDVTNKHYLLQQHYDISFVRYLTENKLIQFRKILRS
jgi:hypothetical protein